MIKKTLDGKNIGKIPGIQQAKDGISLFLKLGDKISKEFRNATIACQDNGDAQAIKHLEHRLEEIHGKVSGARDEIRLLQRKIDGTTAWF